MAKRHWKPRAARGPKWPLCMVRNLINQYGAIEEYGGAGYGRVIVGGRIVRLETDGNGRLVEIDEGPAPTTYADRQQVAAARAWIAELETKRAQTTMTAPERDQAVLVRVEQHGPISTRDLTAMLPCKFTDVAHSMLRLRQRGLVAYHHQGAACKWYRVQS